LAASFEEEATRLKRKDEASRLIALRSSISQQLEQAKSLEIAASYGHTKAKLITSLAELAVGIGIRMASEDKRALAFSDHLLKNLGGKERPFGTVLISIGPMGVPDDVGVVSISRLARESNRVESEAMNELRERGYLLLSENAFSFLMDKLIKAVQEGRFLLPIPVEKLSEVNASGSLKLEAKKLQGVPHSQPR
jgi:hypothetical protein